MVPFFPPLLRMELRRFSMSSTSVSANVMFVLGNDSVVFEDMINMINLDFKPLACCWVHRKGQAQGLLAMLVWLDS